MATSTEQAIQSLEQRLAKMEAREAIHTVLYTYARGADRCDMELFKSCYHPDGTDYHWFFNGNAHDLADWVIPHLRELPNSQHSITNPIIDLQGDRAFVESQWYVVHRIPLDDKRTVDQQIEGRYLDVFEKRDDVWKILHRRVALEGFRELVVPAIPSDNPALSKRFPDDAVYKGFDILDDREQKFPSGYDLWEEARQRHSLPL
ncbi:hypothetical protein KCU73_g3721, partial [Aureobasidium melanogenum]